MDSVCALIEETPSDGRAFLSETAGPMSAKNPAFAYGSIGAGSRIAAKTFVDGRPGVAAKSRKQHRVTHPRLVAA